MIATSTKCHDCGVAPGMAHDPGCDVEQCALCGQQAITCDCVYRVNGLERRTLKEAHPDLFEGGPADAMAAAFVDEQSRVGGPLLWTGVYPGEVECAELGWFAKLGPRGWVACGRDEDGASPDLNRYAAACAGEEPGFRWDPHARRLARVQ